jgi:hypothetical protein
MKAFIKNLLLFLSPFILWLISYFIFDPFRVLYNYKDYSKGRITLNLDVVSTETYIHHYKKYQYNSFILGSSRAIAYKPKSWEKYLPADASPYVMNAHGESIFGIYTKLKFLDETKEPIRNALIILCHDVSFPKDMHPSSHLFIKDPLITKDSYLNFHLQFLKAYSNPQFFLSAIYYQLTYNYKNFMQDYIENRTIIFDTVTNELNNVEREQEINSDPANYYTKRSALFYKREGEVTDSAGIISNEQIFMLQEIVRIFKKNNSSYRVVISPLYEQVKFSKRDLQILKNEFGDNLYDFSGSNKFTNSIRNYYEASHYRPFIGDSIMSLIYKQPNPNISMAGLTSSR